MRVLFIGAHTDDIEHGAGGVFNLFLEKYGNNIKYLTFSKCTDISRNKDILKDQENVTKYIESYNGIINMLDFPNRKLFTCSQEIREILEQERDVFNPELVFTHWHNDIHQDHQVINAETLRVFRTGSIIEYECLRSCPNFIPNLFYILSDKNIARKINVLSLYKTQQVYYNSREVIKSLAIIRGAAINKIYAEGFYVQKLIGSI